MQAISPQKTKNLNVFDLLSKDDDLQAYSTTGSICWDIMKAKEATVKISCSILTVVLRPVGD